MGDKRIEVFIRCPVCNYEQVLRQSSIEIERLIGLRTKWESYARYARARYGVPSSMAAAHLKKIRLKIRELEDEIAD